MEVNLVKLEEKILTDFQNATRLSDLPSGTFNSYTSRKGLKKAIQKGWIRVNNEPAYTATLVKNGDLISLYRNEESNRPNNLRLKLEVLWEDDHLAVINKPAGILVNGNKKWTVENALSQNLKISSQTDFLKHPQAIHRLDYPTTGTLLVGKTSTSVIALNKLFSDKQVDKRYMAICIGELPQEGDITELVDGKESHSSFKKMDTVVSERFSFLNLVRLIPHTGRRHQLRQHLASISCPILGDAQYGIPGKILHGKGLYLHSEMIAFKHPVSEEKIEFVAPLPKKFGKIFPPKNI